MFEIKKGQQSCYFLNCKDKDQEHKNMVEILNQICKNMKFHKLVQDSHGYYLNEKENK